MRPILRLTVTNFRSFRSVSVELQPLNVLVGPNEAGKSNFLDAIRFLGDSARVDLDRAIEARGGFHRVRFRGVDEGAVALHVEAQVTSQSSVSAPDDYTLKFWTRSKQLQREETLTFKRTKGRGRRFTVKGNKVQSVQLSTRPTNTTSDIALRSTSLALSTLQELPSKEGGDEIRKLAETFLLFKVFNVDVKKATEPARLTMGDGVPSLASDASNLAEVLFHLSKDEEVFADFMRDVREMIPGLEDVTFELFGGSAPAYAVRLREKGLRDATYLADASFGTVRILALLALLYDQSPPPITCIEEIDHGLHPYVFDRLVERLREASTRTQLLVVTHSPALVNRLRPQELIVVERAEDGSTRMPAVTTEELEAMLAATDGELGLGELWFSGTLGGVPR